MSVQSGLNKLGELRGRTEAEFEKILGPPRAFRTLFTGKRLLEWRSGRFRLQSIAVLFDADQRFADIVNHYQVRVPGPDRGPSPFVEGLRAGLDLFAGEYPSPKVPRRRTGVWTPLHRTRTVARG